MKKIFLILISSISGFLIILGLFSPGSILEYIRANLLNWAVILSGIALLIAILNLLAVHWNKVFTDTNRDIASSFFIVGFITVLLIGILLGPADHFFINLNRTIILSVEASMMAVLALTLALACFRFFTRKQNLLSLIFGISTIVFLLLFSGILSLGENIPLMKPIITGLKSLPIAGSTGILIGISLGATITSLRILFGTDRPYDR